MQGWGPARCVETAVGVAVVCLGALAAATPAAGVLKPIGEFGGPKSGELGIPFDLERDAAGNTYVTDPLSHSIQKYDSQNRPVLRWGELGTAPGEIEFPHAIGVNEATGAVYVADFEEGATQLVIEIERYDANGNFLGEFGSFGEGEGQFSEPIGGIAVDTGTGDVFTTDGERVQRFSATGQFELMWGKNVIPGGGTGPETCFANCQLAEDGDDAGELDGAQGITVALPLVYVAEENNHRISRFNGNTGAFQLMGGRDVTPGGGMGAETCAAVCKAGAVGAGPGEFNQPMAVDLNVLLGRLFVLDANNFRVQRLNPGNFAFQVEWGGEGGADGFFRDPRSLAESGGTVMVADALLQRVQRFNTVGAFQAKFGTPGLGTLLLPFAVAAGSGGVYVTDARNTAYRYDAAGTPISRFGGEGSGPGQLSQPLGAAVAPDGTVYIADSGNNRIQRFDSTGALLGEWGSLGSAPGQFAGPRDVAVGPDGTVYVADGSNDRIQRFDPAGLFQAEWGSSGAALGQLDEPSGIAVDSKGDVYVAERINDRIQKFDSNGVPLTIWGGNGAENGRFDRPNDVAVDAAGNVYVVDTGNDRVQIFSSTGEFRERVGAADGALGDGPGEFSTPGSIAVDPSGYVYVAEQNNNRVQRFANEPVLKIKGKKRQRAPRLKVRLICSAGPCRVVLGGAGKTTAPKTKLKLKQRQLTLAAGERRTLKLKLRKAEKRLRAIDRSLRDGGKAKLKVRAPVTNEAGTSLAKRKLKLKR